MWLWRSFFSLTLLFLSALVQRHQRHRHRRGSGLGRLFRAPDALDEIFRVVHVVPRHRGHGREDVFLLGLLGPWVTVVDAADALARMLAERWLAAQLTLVDADGRSPDVAILDQRLLQWLAALVLCLAAECARRTQRRGRRLKPGFTLALVVERHVGRRLRLLPARLRTHDEARRGAAGSADSSARPLAGPALGRARR